jgi:hypothetical protein
MNSYVTSYQNVVQLKDSSQAELGVPRDTHAIETPKVPSCGFNPHVLCPLTLVPIKRAWGVPLANEINKLMDQPQRTNNHRVKLRVLESFPRKLKRSLTFS